MTLASRVGNALIRGFLTAIGDGSAMQTVQVGGRAGEVKGGVERFQNYGSTSHPLPESPNGQAAEAVVIAIEPDMRVVVVCDDRRYRPRANALRPGDVALYTDLDDAIGSFHAPGDPSPVHRIQLSRDDMGEPVTYIQVGDARVTITSAKITMDVAEVEITGRLIDNTAAGNVNHVDTMRSIYDGHTHPENDSGGPTDEPIQPQGPY